MTERTPRAQLQVPAQWRVAMAVIGVFLVPLLAYASMNALRTRGRPFPGLLTDPFGDIHPDSRGLGLYASDTRLLSCCSLRVGGERPVLLQGSMGANYFVEILRTINGKPYVCKTTTDTADHAAAVVKVCQSLEAR